nr:reverse transcriptase domain-containing protein [Tanacetum cinerariifolium]
MSTRSSARNLFPPLDNPELIIRRRSRVDPTLLNDFEMATEGNGDPLVPDLRTMEELCQPTLNGRGRPIAPIAIQATNFGLKNDMIQQVQNSCQFHGLPGDDANKHLDKLLHVTQSIKVNGVTDDALHLYLFPHSLTHHTTAWFDHFSRNSINTFEQMAKMFLGKYFRPSMVTKLRNEITNFRQHPDESLFEAWEHYKLSVDRCPNHNILPVTQIDTLYNGLTLRHRDTINVAAGGTFMKRSPEECYDLIENMTAHHNDWDTSVQRSESSSSITSSSDLEIVALKAKMAKINKNLMKVLQINQQVKAVTHNCKTCGGPHSYNDCPATVGQTQNVYASRAYNQGSNSYQPLVEHETEVTKDMVPPTNNRSTKDVQPLVFQIQNQIPNSEPVVAPVSAPKPNPRPSIPYPSRLHDLKLRDKTNDQKEKFFKIFKDLDFNISFADALILMPKFGPSITSLLTNKEKLFELARTPLNEHCSMVNLKKLPEKLGDPGELTLRVGKEAVTFNLDQTSRYSTNYDAMSVNQIDLINVACEEYSQEVLGFSKSGNPTLSTEPIVSNSSPTLTLFGDKFLNYDPSSPTLPPQELKIVKPTNEKSSIDEPPVVELKDFPPHLEYAFLEGDDKLPVIIAKDFKDEEKTALIKVWKSHKQALACPWVSPVHCVPKKGGFTVVENEENELIPTRLVMGWRVCTDYQKLNDATRKDHFPLSFMDQMLERLAGNEYYYFLDGFLGYFQISIDPQDQEKITFTSPYGTFACRRMPFGLCNASGTFQRCGLEATKNKAFSIDTLCKQNNDRCSSSLHHDGKELLAVVYAFEKFRPYLVLSKSILYTDHSALKYLSNKQDAKPRLLRWVLFLQEFDITVRDKIGAENLAADHLSRLENPHQSVDFMGPFPSSRGNKYILMAVDYLSKWVEANALPTNDARVVCKFLKSLFAKFGTPRAIISDRGTHFCNDQFVKVMLKYGVTHRLATTYHPQTSGQVEVSNRGLKRILERTVGENRASCSDKLDDALWAFLQLNELNELRDQAYENSLIYKKKRKRIHDSKIKDRDFNVGDRVLLFNSRLNIFSGKLKTRWSGPFTITQVFPYGTVELSQTDGPKMVVPDLQTFPKDQ